MSQNRTQLDLSKKQKQAGQELPYDGVTTRTCMDMQKNNNNPGTPEHIKKYRKSYKTQEGVKILHYGFYDNKIPDQYHAYGKKSGVVDPVQSVLHDKKQDGINQLINDIKEGQYHSKKTEPLGKTIDRHYNWPEQTKQNDKFQFGVATVKNEFSAKEIVNPVDIPILESKANEQLYLKSHKTYQAGEQKNRNYNLPFEKNDHVYGKTIGQTQNAAKSVIQPENDTDSFPKTSIVKKNQIDMKNFKEDPIGRPKNLGQSNKYTPDGFTYGQVDRRDQWNAAKQFIFYYKPYIDVFRCIQGEANWKEVKNDKNLGTTTRFGFRNQVKQGDENRMFGVPTIRNDINKKGLKSVGDINNYGDEPNAIQLLTPQKFISMGLDADDFQGLRPKNEIRDIFEAIGIQFNIAKFQALFQKALGIMGRVEGDISLKAFMQAVQEYSQYE